METFDKIEDAISDISQGKMIIVVDDENRENEGDFVMAAELVKPEHINFMAKYGRGMICAPISEELARKFSLTPMVGRNTCSRETAFTQTIDAKEGITTGISAADRAKTIQLLCQPDANADSFVKPGHIFPLIAKSAGVLQRDGHTEAAVDFSKLAGLQSAGVICEVMKDDGTMARLEDLIELKKKFNLKLVTIKDLITYRQKNEQTIHKIESIPFPNKYGEFDLHIFQHSWEDKETVVLTKGDVEACDDLLVRVHSECFTGDIFGSSRCDCGDQLATSMKEIEKAGQGMVIYLQQEGRGIGLANKIKAYKLQDQGMDTVEANHQLGFDAEMRDFASAYQALKYFNVRSIRLMTNNPLKINSLREFGVYINERVPLEIDGTGHNSHYLLTKKTKMGHLLEGLSLQ